MDFYKSIFKPGIDFLASCLLLIFLSPFLFIIFIIGKFVFATSLFSQIRIGKNEHAFLFFKFRSMKVPGDERSIPTWGRFLRYSSLDELPQLINIFRGEMSFVGPRPLLPEYLQFYTEEQRKRHWVKPGLTGLAQVSGRNTLPWQESLRLDAQYAENCSFLADVKILLRTIPQLFKFREVHQSKGLSRKAFKKENR